MKRWFWVFDVATVMSFVIIGRDTHGLINDWSETLLVALPFLLAMSMGIGVAMMFTDPANWVGGLVIAALTVIGGLALRKYVFGDGTATTFVILTAAWMTSWMVGWRLVAVLVSRIVARRGASATA